jgi:hypothetical protein
MDWPANTQQAQQKFLKADGILLMILFRITKPNYHWASVSPLSLSVSILSAAL